MCPQPAELCLPGLTEFTTMNRRHRSRANRDFGIFTELVSALRTEDPKNYRLYISKIEQLSNDKTIHLPKHLVDSVFGQPVPSLTLEWEYVYHPASGMIRKSDGSHAEPVGAGSVEWCGAGAGASTKWQGLDLRSLQRFTCGPS